MWPLLAGRIRPLDSPRDFRPHLAAFSAENQGGRQIQACTGELHQALTGSGAVIDTWQRGGDWANLWLSLRQVPGSRSSGNGTFRDTRRASRTRPSG
jgi:hypothetical protein